MGCSRNSVNVMNADKCRRSITRRRKDRRNPAEPLRLRGNQAGSARLNLMFMRNNSLARDFEHLAAKRLGLCLFQEQETSKKRCRALEPENRVLRVRLKSANHVRKLGKVGRDWSHFRVDGMTQASKRKLRRQTTQEAPKENDPSRPSL